MKLHIDNREPMVLKEWLVANIEMECIFGNLPAGDFEFKSATGNSHLLIERKEISDLCSSLRDGRFDDQKQKLSATVADEPRPIAFLIEGDYAQHEMSNTIESIMLTTRFRDGFFVLQSKSIQDTGTLLQRISDLFKRGKLDPISDEELHRRFISSRSMHRAGGQLSRRQDWWQLALAQIDGVGPKAAEAVTAKYPTAKDLINAYQSCKSQAYREQLLTELPMGKRRIGPKISEKICTTVFLAATPAAAAAPTTTAESNQKRKPGFISKPREVTNECLFVADD